MSEGSVATARTRSVLEEEREFFLRSLRDLEDERAAGDIDQADYEALRDDYTVRAAAVLRELEAAEPEPAPRPAGDRAGRRRNRTVLAVRVVAVLLVIGGVTWAVAAAAGVRLPGDGVSGGGGATTNAKVTDLLAEAQTAIHHNKPTTAVKDFTAALKIDPTSVEGLTGEGGVLVQLGNVGHDQNLTDVGIAMLARAEKLDAGYFPAFGNLGEILFSEGHYAEAIPQLRTYERLTPKTPSTRAGLATAATELRLAEARDHPAGA